MTRTIRVHFDGQVFVPDEPVDVPPNESLQITIEVGGERNLAANVVQQRREALARFLADPSPAEIPDSGLSREQLYED